MWLMGCPSCMTILLLVRPMSQLLDSTVAGPAKCLCLWGVAWQLRSWHATPAEISFQKAEGSQAWAHLALPKRGVCFQRASPRVARVHHHSSLPFSILPALHDHESSDTLHRWVHWRTCGAESLTTLAQSTQWAWESLSPKSLGGRKLIIGSQIFSHHSFLRSHALSASFLGIHSRFVLQRQRRIHIISDNHFYVHHATQFMGECNYHLHVHSLFTRMVLANFLLFTWRLLVTATHAQIIGNKQTNRSEKGGRMMMRCKWFRPITNHANDQCYSLSSVHN